jgi:Na+/phosphate symporter
VDLVPALAVTLRANVGTTLIVQILSFDIARVAPLFVLIGVILFRRGSASRTHDLGRVAIGLGLMLLALQGLLALMTPFEGAPSMRVLLGAIETQPVIDVIAAAALTWAAHSSIATVLLTTSLAAQRVVPPHAALALVLGANVGSALNPLIEGAAGDDPAAKRVPAGNLLMRAPPAACSVKRRCSAISKPARRNRISRIRAGRVESVETSALHVDVLRELKRINAHIAAASYAVLERRGELLPSRLRQDADSTTITDC